MYTQFGGYNNNNIHMKRVPFVMHEHYACYVYTLYMVQVNYVKVSQWNRWKKKKIIRMTHEESANVQVPKSSRIKWQEIEPFSVLVTCYYQFSVGILLIRWFKITIDVHTFNTNHPIYKLLTIYSIKIINFTNRISIIFLFISINPTGIPISVVYRHRMNIICLHLFSLYVLGFLVFVALWICRAIECDCWHCNWKTPLSRSLSLSLIHTEHRQLSGGFMFDATLKYGIWGMSNIYQSIN